MALNKYTSKFVSEIPYVFCTNVIANMFPQFVGQRDRQDLEEQLQRVITVTSLEKTSL